MVSALGRATVGHTGSRALKPNRRRSIAVVAMALALLAAPMGLGAQANVTSPFTPTYKANLSRGISYQRGTMWTSPGLRQAVHVATVDLRRPDVTVKSVLSNDKVVGKEVVLSMADRRRRRGFRPIVAVNGDVSTFGRVDGYAAPRSLAVSNRELLAAYACVRPVLGIDADGTARIAAVRAHITLTLPGETEPHRVERLNTHRDDDAVVLFTSRFAKSTRTPPRGVEVILDLEGKVRANGTQTVRVLRVRRGRGNTPIRPGRAVLSVNNPEEAWVYSLVPGHALTLQTQVVKRVNKACGGKVKAANGWGAVVETQGGNRFTVRDGVVHVPPPYVYEPGWRRHPRTGVGLTADGRLLMVTVDGRRKASRGVTLEEMGQLMVSLGAEQAFNLDGGGSTVMVRFDRRAKELIIANKPSDGRQRPATQALAAFSVRLGP